MPGSRLEYLFECFVNNTCTKGEEKEFMEMLSLPDNEAIVQSLIDKYIAKTGAEVQMPDHVAASVLENIFKRDKGNVIPIKKKKTTLSYSWMRVAAAAMLILGFFTYRFLVKSDKQHEKVVIAERKISPILPGGNKAFLTMSDGTIMILDSIENGPLQKVNTKVDKLDGLLIYNASSTESNTEVQYNTLTTPRGGQYQVLLPDGSKVWLNAASSLTFPTLFKGNQRDVQLTGEAYFEIAKNKKKPFHVNMNGVQIKVLGTHFNVNAYSDEDAIKTSLLEGSVEITNGKTSDLLKPGQQAVLRKLDSKVNIINVDLAVVMAWKNGLFTFEGASINTIMREIGRWYDVEIQYQGKLPDRKFEGKISRNMQLSEVLEILKLSQVEFTMKDKKIVVK